MKIRTQWFSEDDGNMSSADYIDKTVNGPEDPGAIFLPAKPYQKTRTQKRRRMHTAVIEAKVNMSLMI